MSIGMKRQIVVMGLQDMSDPARPVPVEVESLDWKDAILESESKPRQRPATDFEQYSGKAKVVRSPVPFGISDPDTVLYNPQDWIVEIEEQYFGITVERFPFRARLLQTAENASA